MRKYIFGCLLLLCGTVFAEDLPILGLAHVGFRVSDLEKARAFYHGILGYEEAFDLKDSAGNVKTAYFKVNDNQFIEIHPGPAASKENLVMMTNVCMYTKDIEKLHKTIEERGLKPGPIGDSKDGNRSFAIRNPPGQVLGYVEFTQYMPGSLQRQSAGKFMSGRRISTRFLHAGIVVTDFEATQHFWIDQMGFSIGRKAHPRAGKRSDVKVGGHIAITMPGPSGDYFEINNPTRNQTVDNPKFAGVFAHISLAIPDVDLACSQVKERGYVFAPRLPGQITQPHDQWLDVYDPDGTRVELTAEKPTLHPDAAREGLPAPADK